MRYLLVATLILVGCSSPDKINPDLSKCWQTPPASLTPTQTFDCLYDLQRRLEEAGNP